MLGLCLRYKYFTSLAVTRPYTICFALPTTAFLSQMLIGRYYYFFGKFVPETVENQRSTSINPDCVFIIELLSKFFLGFFDEGLGVLDAANGSPP